MRSSLLVESPIIDISRRDGLVPLPAFLEVSLNAHLLLLILTLQLQHPAPS